MADFALSAGEADVDAYRRRRRRCWTLEEKLAIVLEAEGSIDPVAQVARRHGMNANHLFNWRQRYRDGTLDRSQVRERSASPPADRSLGAGGMDFFDLGVVGAGRRADAGMIEIELPGRARIRVGAQVDVEALRQVLAAVRGGL